MLKHALLLLFCCFSAAPIVAQDTTTPAPLPDIPEKRLRFGLKGGTNLSTFAGEAINTDVRYDLHGGGFLHYRLNRRLALQPELLFSGEGTRYDNTNTEADLNYLTLPVVLKVYLTRNINLHAGPYASYLLKAQLETDIGSSSLDHDYRKGDFGLNFGGAIEAFHYGIISARYKIGLTDVYKGPYTLSKPEYYNSVFQVSVGLLL